MTSDAVYEIPLYKIRSVAARNIIIRDGVSFSTDDVVVKISSGALYFQSEFVREMLIELIADASPPELSVPEIDKSASGNQPAYRAQVVDCKGCGAAVIVYHNLISWCEYCDRPVEYK